MPFVESVLSHCVVLPAALTKAEYMASIPKQKGEAPPPPMSIGTTVVEGTAGQHGMNGTATGNDAADDTPRVPALRDTTSPSKRKVSILSSTPLMLHGQPDSLIPCFILPGC